MNGMRTTPQGSLIAALRKWASEREAIDTRPPNGAVLLREAADEIERLRVLLMRSAAWVKDEVERAQDESPDGSATEEQGTALLDEIAAAFRD